MDFENLKVQIFHVYNFRAHDSFYFEIRSVCVAYRLIVCLPDERQINYENFYYPDSEPDIPMIAYIARLVKNDDMAIGCAPYRLVVSNVIM